MEFNGKRIANSLDPQRDLKNLEDEYNVWMGTVKDTWLDYEREKSALEKHFGKDFRSLDEALRALAARPKYKAFCDRLGEYQESWRELKRLCRLTEVAPDTSASWSWMVKEKTGGKNGSPAHPYHTPTKHTHFQEGPKKRRSIL